MPLLAFAGLISEERQTVMSSFSSSLQDSLSRFPKPPGKKKKKGTGKIHSRLPCSDSESCGDNAGKILSTGLLD